MFVADVQHLYKNTLPHSRLTIAYNLSLEAQNEFTVSDKNLSIDIMESKGKNYAFLLNTIRNISPLAVLHFIHYQYQPSDVSNGLV